MAKTIVILTLDNSPDLMQGKALLSHMALAWETQGVNVKIVRGIKEVFEADVVVSHIDLTVVPNEYSEFVKNYPVAINGRINDISKSLISNNLLQRESDYDGPVIVKTQANYGGIPELIQGNGHEILERPWRRVQHLDSYNYPKFNAIRDVPNGVWRNDNLIVEKFLPEIDSGGNYCLRKWFFFGDKNMGLYQTSSKPIVKFGDIENEIISDVPDELKVLRERLNMEYGRFDYAIVDGEVVIYDANKTPIIGDVGLSLLGDKLDEFSAGITQYLD